MTSDRPGTGAVALAQPIGGLDPPVQTEAQVEQMFDWRPGLRAWSLRTVKGPIMAAILQIQKVGRRTASGARRSDCRLVVADRMFPMQVMVRAHNETVGARVKPYQCRLMATPENISADPPPRAACRPFRQRGHGEKSRLRDFQRLRRLLVRSGAG